MKLTNTLTCFVITTGLLFSLLSNDFAIAHDGLHDHDHQPAQVGRKRTPALPVATVVTSLRKADDPNIARHFKPFAESIKYRWDENYFYVESNGMPDHEMMVGITAWQRQIPIPHNYSGNNAWRIPLNPIPAEKPMSAKTNFFRGAIALAVNGVPIFNPIKNDGRTDTNLAGELDEFGGHCGRADDYHYHLPPVHLEKIVGEGEPIAYALDGYPIFGYQSKEEAGKSKLDTLNGHKDAKGNYHYHSTKEYPYLNGGFYGKVVELDGQVDPQPRAQGIRPAGRPLQGATITGFERSEDGKEVWLEYLYIDEKRTVSYTTEDFKSYAFTFDKGSRGKTTENYKQDSQRRGGHRPDRGGPPRDKRPSGKDTGPDQSGKLPRGADSTEGPRQPWIVVHAAEIDLNGDKVISRDEMVGEAEKAFAGYDKNNDEKLSADELAERGGSRSAMGGFLRGHSKEIDRDGDRILTRKEAVGNAERMFGKMDSNQDNRIDQSELDGARRTDGNQDQQKKEKRDKGVGKGGDQKQTGEKQTGDKQSGSRLGGYETPPPVNNVPAHEFDILLGRPTADSITVSTLLYFDADAVLFYGTKSNELTDKTKPCKLTAGEPKEIEIDGLKANTSYYYQLKYRGNGVTETQSSEVYSFHTQRSVESAFRFTVQADSHLDENTSGEVYLRTLRNALGDSPDFHVALGDTFMTGKYVRPELALPQYLAQRYYLGTLCHSTPLFFCLGNHDGESSKAGANRQGGRSKGNRENKSVNSENPTRTWSASTRKKYIPNPYPAKIYTGNQSDEPDVGQVEDYYAWHWGNSLFIVLDPFWYSDGRAKEEGNHWHQTLGDAQYQWLTETLEGSAAKFKFVFIHHLVGGADRNNRGGVSAAPFFEWGGRELDDSKTFSSNRSRWKLPIHDLLVKHDVSIVFHGHDHLYAKEELDGIIYQAVPQPGHPKFGNVRSADEYGYAGEVISSSGHLRVSVSPDEARVDYVRAYLPKDETERRSNREVGNSYLVR